MHPNAPRLYDLDWTNAPDEELVAFVENQYERGKARRARWERKAQERLALLEGDDEITWNDKNQVLEAGDEQIIPLEYRRPIRINNLRSFILQRVAFILAQPVQLHALPATGDEADVAAASLQTKLLQYMWRGGPNSIRSRFVWALFHLFGAGVLWIKTCWDPDAGEPERFGPDIDPADDEPTRKRKTDAYRAGVAKKLGTEPDRVKMRADGTLLVPPGAVAWDFVTGFEITEPPMCRSIEEAGWLIESRYRPVEWVRHRYGDAAAGLTPDFRDDPYYFAEYKALYGLFREENESADNPDDAEVVRVHTLWRPRTAWLPRGACVTVCQGQLLHRGDHPYTHGQLPFTKMYELPSNRIRPPCTAEMMVNLQRARNHVNSLIAGHVGMTIAPKILHEKGAVDAENFDKHPRLVEVQDDAIDKVRAFQWPSLPPAAMELDERLRRNMQDVAGVHDSTLGREVSASQSGRHAAMLREGNVMSNVATRESVDAALRACGHQSLWLWWQYGKEERLVRIAGEGSRIEVIQFKRDDLLSRSPGPNDFDVQVVVGQDVDGTMRQIESLTAMGWLSPERESDRLHVLRLLGDRVPPTEADDATVARRNARAEHDELLAGRDIDVALGDLDEVHLAEHERWTTTEEYRQAVRKNPQIKTRLRVHHGAHLQQRASKKIRPVVIEEREVRRALIEFQQGRDANVAALRNGRGGAMPVGGDAPMPVAPEPAMEVMP